MNAVTSAESASQSARRMISFLLSTLKLQGVFPAPASMPPGSVYLPDARLMVGATSCGEGIYHREMCNIAMATGADIIIAHGTSNPHLNGEDPVSFSALVHVDCVPRLFDRMVLFFEPAVGYWLLAFDERTYIALEPLGPRASSRPPYLDRWEREAGVKAAAEKIIHATRNQEAF